MRRLVFLALIAAAISATLLASSADAQAPMNRVRVGVLECRGGASIGFVVGSVTNLGCVLRVEGFPEDRYIATIRKVGLDLGITQETALAWGVFAPVTRLAPGDLTGTYAGVQGRFARHRRRRQCAGRRLQQFDRAAAAERAGPGRPQRRGRTGEPRASPGTVIRVACRMGGAKRYPSYQR